MLMDRIITTWQTDNLTFTLENTLLTNRTILVIIRSHTLQVAPSYHRRATKRWVSLMNGIVQMLQVSPSLRRRATKQWHDFGAGASMAIIFTQMLKVAPSYHTRVTKQGGYISLGTGVVRMLEVAPSLRRRATKLWQDMAVIFTQTLKVAPSPRRRVIKR